MHHPLLPSLSDEEVVAEVSDDVKNIERLTGVKPTGMAYPCGGCNHDERVIKLLAENDLVKYARTIISTYDFKIPECFLRWNPTVWLFDEKLEELTSRFAEVSADSEDIVFYIWGHAYEFDFFDGAWDKYDKYFKKMVLNGNSRKI